MPSPKQAETSVKGRQLIFAVISIISTRFLVEIRNKKGA